MDANVPDQIFYNGSDDEAASRMEAILHNHAERLGQYIDRKLPRRCREVVDAQDILQDVFLEAFRLAESFTPQGPDAAERWLITIARHRILAVLRRMRTVRISNVAAGADSGEIENVIRDFAVYLRTPSQSAMSHEIAAAVQNSLSRLEPHFREAIQLRYLRGLSIIKSAIEMGRTEGAVCMLCRRGLSQLKTDLLRVKGLV